MNYKVNLAIQVLPLEITKKEAYRIIDEVIIRISASGLAYTVCPFETVVEGSYADVMKLLEEIQATCRQQGAKEVLINMKLQQNFEKDVLILEKTGKYTV